MRKIASVSNGKNRNLSLAVLNDTLSTMLNRKFVCEMFTPGGLSTQATLKSLMEKIVHGSIMRLGQESLDKLFDLMIMSVKLQVFSVTQASSLLTMTQTHIASWTSLTNDPETLLRIQHMQGLVTNVIPHNSEIKLKQIY